MQEPEKKEKELHGLGDYKTCKNMGAKQAQDIKAIDFVDEWSDNMQLCSVRRRNTGLDAKEDCACSCGLAFPSEMRWRGPGVTSRGEQGKFWCKVNWKALVTTQESSPEDELMKKW
eukprot:3292460-Pyramimonas_sp.AAC.1